MKIIYIDGTHEFGGAVVSLSFMLKGLQRLGVETAVVTAQKKQLTDELFPSVRVFRIKPFISYNHRFKLGRFIDNKGLHRFRWLFMRMYSLCELISGLFYLFGLLRFFIKERPDVIHLNNNLDQWESVAAARIVGVPCVIHQRSFASPSRTMKWCSRRADRIITISDAIRDHLIALGCDGKKILTIYNTIDLPNDINTIDFKKTFDAPCTDNKPVCSVFGRITQWKGQHIFIDAIAEARKSIPNILALIVGDAPDGANEYLQALYKQVENNSLKENIIFTGYRSDVGNFYGISDIVVHTSIEPEPFGRTILEAMSYAKPVIATAMGGPLEIIEEGVDGILIHPNDSQVLAQHIVRLFQDEEKRRNIGARAREKVRREFSVEHQAKRMKDIYQGLIEA